MNDAGHALEVANHGGNLCMEVILHIMCLFRFNMAH